MSDDNAVSSSSSTRATRRHAVEAERALIGACISGGGSAVEEACEEGLRDVDFARAAHAVVWRALLRIIDRGEPLSSIAIVDELLAGAELEAAGGAAGVAALEAGIARLDSVRAAARAIVEDANLRRIAEAADLIRRGAVDRDAGSAELLAQAQQVFLALNRRSQRDEVADREAIVRQVLAASASPAPRGLRTGWPSVDAQMRRGLRRGQLIIVGARPSMGKTAWGHQLAAQVADEGVPSAFISCEMDPEELIEREIGAVAGVGSDLWRTRDGAARAAEAAARVAERPLHIVHAPGISITELSARARRLVGRHGVQLIVVDYLGLVAGSGAYAGQRTQEVGEVSRGLKALAGQLQVPIVALSQLNRAVEGRGDKRPGLSDLRDSGEIEQDADVVVFLHRPEYYLRERTPADKLGVAEVIIAKQRNGPTGIVELKYDGPTTSFSEPA